MDWLHLRFRWWLAMQRVCDMIGGPMDALIIRVPWLADRTGACILLHGVSFRGNVPEEWWG